MSEISKIFEELGYINEGVGIQVTFSKHRQYEVIPYLKDGKDIYAKIVDEKTFHSTKKEEALAYARSLSKRYGVPIVDRS